MLDWLILNESICHIDPKICDDIQHIYCLIDVFSVWKKIAFQSILFNQHSKL